MSKSFATAQDESWRELVPDTDKPISTNGTVLATPNRTTTTRSYSATPPTTTRQSATSRTYSRSTSTPRSTASSTMMQSSRTTATTPTQNRKVSNQPYKPPQPYSSRSTTTTKTYRSSPSTYRTGTPTSPNRETTRVANSTETVSKRVVSNQPYTPRQPYTRAPVRMGAHSAPPVSQNVESGSVTPSTTTRSEPSPSVRSASQPVNVQTTTDRPEADRSPPKQATLTTPKTTRPTKLPSAEMLNDILWSTIEVIELSKSKNDFRYLWQIASPDMKKQSPPDGLREMFQHPEVRNVVMSTALGVTPRYELRPHIRPDGKLRLRGSFDVPPKDLRFDVIYVFHEGIWRLDAMAFANS